MLSIRTSINRRWHINFPPLSWLYTFTNGCTACNCDEIILLNWFCSFACNLGNLNLLNGHPCSAEGGKKHKEKKIKRGFFISLLFDFESFWFVSRNTSDVSFNPVIRLLPVHAISRDLRAIQLPRGEIQNRILLPKHRCPVTLQILCDLSSIQLPHQKEYGSSRSQNHIFQAFGAS